MQDSKEIYFPKMLSVVLIFLAILFFIPDMVIFKIVQIGPIQESVAILFFPLTYSISDAITEVYGKDKTFLILIACYLISLLFSVMVKWAINLPSPSDWPYQQAFNIVFDKGPWIILAGMISVTASMYANVKLMSNLKNKMRGRHFIVRSVISSTIGELVITGIAYPLIFYSSENSTVKLMINAYFFKVIYSIVAAFPARILVFLLREIDGIQQNEYNQKFRIAIKS